MFERREHPKERKSSKKGKGMRYTNIEPESINWKTVESVFIVVALGLILGALLLGLFFLFSDSPSAKVITNYAAEASTLTRNVNILADHAKRSMDGVNITKTFKQLFPQTDEESFNVTMRLKRTGSDIIQFIDDVQQSGIVKSVAALANTAMQIVMGPNFERVLNSFETGIPLVFETLDKEETKEFLSVSKVLMDRVSQILTEDRADRILTLLEQTDAKEVFSSLVSLAKEGTVAVRSINVILERVDTILDNEEEYIIPVIQRIKHIDRFIMSNINEQEITHTIAKLKKLPWGAIGREIMSYKILLEDFRDYKSNTSIIDIGKNLTVQIAGLVGDFRKSGIIHTGSVVLTRLNNDITDTQIRDTLVELIKTLHFANNFLGEVKDHNVVEEVLTLIDRVEKMEDIVETIIAPFERGMHLYKEEQRQQNKIVPLRIN